MRIKTWSPEMTDKETADLAYWERNVLALHYAHGWYNDDVEVPGSDPEGMELDGLYFGPTTFRPRFAGWRRVLSLAAGKTTFHIPDDFEVGDLPQIKANWDGHTTEEKWARILKRRGIEVGENP